MSLPQSPDGKPEPLALPTNPDLHHLKAQAKDLLTSGQASKLSEAQFRIARLYGFASWPKLKAHVESLQEIGRLKTAIDTNDLNTIQQMMTANPTLHRAPLGYASNGPLTWVAECRVPWEAPTETRLAMARWMIENGSDIHQGGDGPLMRAALMDYRIPMMELLVSYGADVNALWNGNYPIILAPCETLQPGALQWLLDHGANARLSSPAYGDPVSMLLGTYGRNASGKHACLKVLVAAGYTLPDTPPLAVHQGRFDLLAAHIRHDPSILTRHFTDAEIYPPESGLKPGEGLTSTPLEGVTLLHMAIEFDDLEAARFLLDNGANPNVRAAIDSDGFGGQTPLFHTVISMGKRDDSKARLLLEHGADPNARATFRKQLRDMGDPEKDKMREFHNVTPIGYARQYQEPRWVSEPVLDLLTEHGGTE